MPAPKDGRMSAEDFLEWATDREGRFELIDGVVIELMAGAKEGHNIVVGNFADAVRASAKSKGCKTTSADRALVCGVHNVRYPDIVVDCSPPNPDGLAATKPIILIEVLSKSTSQIDLMNKADEYRALSSVEIIVFVDPDEISIKVDRRAEAGTWVSEHYINLEDSIAFPMHDRDVRLSEIYDTLSPRPSTRLSAVRDAGRKS